MSELKEKLTKQVEIIDKTITNKEEKAVVLEAINNMINVFTENIVRLSERQVEIESRVEDILDTLSAIEDELVENFAEDMEAECPYCKEIIPLKFPDDESEDFECPNCHNVIELEMLLDDECGCDCDECSGGCHHNDEDEE